MLKTRAINVGGLVVGRVVIGEVAHEGAVHPGDGLLEDLVVGSRRHRFVHVEHQRGTDDIGGGLGHLADDPAVVAAGLEQVRRPPRASGLEVQHQPDVLGPIVVLHKRARPAQAALLPIGEQEDHVIPQRRARQQRPARLQHGGHTRPVIRGSGAVGHGIVVGAQHEGFRRIGARQPHKNVLRACQAVPEHHHRLHHMRPCPHAAQGVEEIIAYAVVGLGAGAVRHSRERLDMFHRASGGELGRGRALRPRPRRAMGIQRGQCGQQKKEPQDDRGCQWLKGFPDSAHAWLLPMLPSSASRVSIDEHPPVRHSPRGKCNEWLGYNDGTWPERRVACCGAFEAPIQRGRYAWPPGCTNEGEPHRCPLCPRCRLEGSP